MPGLEAGKTKKRIKKQKLFEKYQILWGRLVVHMLLHGRIPPAATEQPEHGLAKQHESRGGCFAGLLAVQQSGGGGSSHSSPKCLVFHHSQTQKTKAVHEDKRMLVILLWELQPNTEYEFQVRARPREDTGYRGFWSEWSPPLMLKTSPRGMYYQLSLPFQLVQC